MTTEELTVKVLELEKAVAELRGRAPLSAPPPKGNWLASVLGRFKDDPEFDKAIEAGRQFRVTGHVTPAPTEDGEE